MKPYELTANCNRKEGFKKLIEHYNCEIGIELGVREAHFATFLLHETKLQTIYGVDIVYCANAVQLEKRHPGKYKFYKCDALDIANRFPNNYFDFIHIDDCHLYHHVKKELNVWYPKLKIGGIFSGDDYMKVTDRIEGEFGIQQAVNEFTQEHNLEFYIIGLNTNDRLLINDYGNERGHQRERRFSGLSNNFQEPPQWYLIKEKEIL